MLILAATTERAHYEWYHKTLPVMPPLGGSRFSADLYEVRIVRPGHETQRITQGLTGERLGATKEEAEAKLSEAFKAWVSSYEARPV